jgi:hypothetical protein
MSYHVTILRTRAGVAHPLSREEVLAAASARPEVRCDLSSDDGLTVVLKAADPESPVLWFRDGELWTKNPDEETLAFMVSFASELGARVRGDEFETYRTVDETYVHPDDAKLLPTGVTPRSKKARFLVLVLTMIVTFVATEFLCRR